ncbi:hypothetical protein CRUP_011340, partial [Coryphaenoides rupestris]
NSMNLPPDKARLLRQYDNEKKWELICDQERFQVKNPPHTYIQKLMSYLDPAVTRKERFQVKNPPHTYIQKLMSYLDPAVTRKKFRRRVQESTQVLRELEISLRTNHIGWVREFLNEENKGLDVLVEYLSFAQYAVTWVREFLNEENKGLDVLVEYLSFAQYAVTFDGDCAENNLENSVDKSKPWSRSIEDFHGGGTLPSPGNGLTRAGRHSTIRTKALVLELLAAVCLVRGGHEIILSAFDNFQEVCVEEQRFEKLMEHFRNEDNNIDFMVACMQFINIVVHSVEDMNFRVHLQYDFTKLSLDDYLDVQIQAYLDNVFDVGALLEDAETKNAALERLSEKLQDTENEAMSKIVELEMQLMQRNKDLDSIRDVYKDASSQVHALRQMVKDRDATLQRQHNLEKKIQELEKQGTIKIHKKSDGDISILATGGAGMGTGTGGVALPPGKEVSGGGGGGGGGVQNYATCQTGFCRSTPSQHPRPLLLLPRRPLLLLLLLPPSPPVKIKKPIKTKFRMPVFNWVALKPNQINGTVFNEIDDERILEDLNVDQFEEMFKTKAQGQALDVTSSRQKISQKGPSKVSLLDSNRAKNLAITLRKVGKAPEEICKSIQIFDLRALPVDYVECLMRFQPTEGEVKIMRQFEKERKPLESLTDEDRFMVQFSKIERLMQKMTIMTFIGNFTESVQMLTPQLHAVIAASVSIKSSQKLKKILEIILALGNYMNSGKRGADRKQTLLHYIANVVKEKYQQVSLFYNELHYVEKAAAVSLDNVLLDVRELQRGMELTRREYSMHGHNTMLKDFIAHSEAKLKKLQDDAKVAQDAFDEVVKFFGENGKTTPPSVFFPPYRRADGVRRSGRRRFDDQSLRPINNTEVVM